MINEETMNVNFTQWVKRLQRYNCYSEEMVNEMGDAITKASFAMSEECGSAYEGSMLDVVLKKLCKFAYDLNLMFGGDESKQIDASHPTLAVNQEMLMRVLLLQHIAKAEMFIPETEKYWIGRGNLYKFAKTDATLKCGERSAYICQKYGIKLNELEYEAMRIIDRDDEKTTMYENPLAFIVKMANRAVSIEQYINYQKSKEA